MTNYQRDRTSQSMIFTLCLNRMLLLISLVYFVLQILADILYKAASMKGWLDPAKVEAILEISKEDAASCFDKAQRLKQTIGKDSGLFVRL